MLPLLTLAALAATAQNPAADAANSRAAFAAAGWKSAAEPFTTPDGAKVECESVRCEKTATMAQLKALGPLTSNYGLILPDNATDEWVKELAARPDAGNLVKLTLSYDIAGGKHTDALAAHLPKLTSLVWLSFGTSPKIGDKSLAAVAGIDSLKVLVAPAGTTDAGLEKLPAGLEEFDVTGPRVGDKGVAHLKKLKDVKRLSLVRTKVTDAGLKSLAALPITHLNLTETAVTDAGVTTVTAMPNLKDLNLFNCKAVTDKGLAAAAKSKSLSTVDVRFTKVTKKGVAAANKTNAGLGINAD